MKVQQKHIYVCSSWLWWFPDTHAQPQRSFPGLGSGGGSTTGHRARGTNGQICKACRAGVWKCAQCPRETLLEAPSPADMIQSPALLWPHKAARAAPIAGGTREKFRGAVITPDWLRCVVTDRSPFSGSALSAPVVDTLQKSPHGSHG